jgi:diguanylate cyclase
MPEQRTTTQPLRSGLQGLFRSRAGSAMTAPMAGQAPDRVGQASREMLERRFAGLNQPEALLLAFADGLAGLGGELADMGLRLQAACGEADWSRGARLLRQLLDKYIRTIETGDLQGHTSGERLRDLSVNLLDNLALSLQPASLAEQAELLADGLRQWQPGLPLEPLEQELRLFDQQLQQNGHAAQEQRSLLLSLFALLLDNVSQLLSPDSWLYAELQTVMPLLDAPLDPAQLQQALQSLRQASYRQGVLQQGLEQASSAMEHFTPQLAGCWSEFALSPDGGQYLDRVRALPLALSQARNGKDLVDLLNTLVKDTVQLQQQFSALQAQHAQLQKTLEQTQAHNQELEAARMQRPVSIDALTGLPGDNQLEGLVAAQLAQMPVLNLGLLAIQGLQQYQREHGRKASAALQQQLAQALSPLLHADEQLVRLAAGQFVMLLPGASLLAAQDRLMSLRRNLAGNTQAPRLRASVMRWHDNAPLDQHLDQLEAALPDDGSESGVELV